MLENHMVLNTADAPWNAPDMPQWECSCGVSHAYDVGKQTYPIWHSRGGYVEECAGNCGRRCCHDCAVTCRICGCHYCPDCRKGFDAGLKLCEECGAHYTVFAPAFPEEAEKLMAIEKRIARGRMYHREIPTGSEIDWLIEQLKEAWESLAAR
jgi:hypothetical protein